MPVILLDLNHTLVANSHVKARPFTRQIEGEEYRAWLLHLFALHEVVLITARPEHHRAQTLAHLEDLTGWRPALACFNTRREMPHLAKLRALREHVFPTYGLPDVREYVAVESNPRTRAMYATHGIPSLTIAASDGDATPDDDPTDASTTPAS